MTRKTQTTRTSVHSEAPDARQRPVRSLPPAGALARLVGLPVHFLFLLAACLVFVSQAFGHVVLVGADPARGAILDDAPDEIVLEMSDAARPSALELLDPRGQSVELGTATVQDKFIHIPLPALQQPGTYMLSWRVAADDGHVMAGTLEFNLVAPSQLAPAALQETRFGSREFAIWLTRWLTYLCLFGLLGAALMRSKVPESPSRGLRWLFPAGLLLLLLDLGLQGADLLGTGPASLLQARIWLAGIDSIYAYTLALFALAMLLARWVLGQPGGSRKILLTSLASLLLAGVGMAASGHASTAAPQWLARPAVTVHAVFVMAWLGSLMPLAYLLGRPQQRIGPALAWFSGWIPFAVFLLLAGGITLMALQLTSPRDLLNTNYGNTLLLKLALVALMLLIAASNRWRLTSAALADEHHARQRLKRAIVLEIVLALAVLAIVSLWRFTPPPRSLQAMAPQMIVYELVNDQAHARIAQLDRSSLWQVELSRPDGQALNAQEISLSLISPNLGVAALAAKGVHEQGAEWRVQLPPLAFPDQWQAELYIVVQGTELIRLAGEQKNQKK